MSTHNILVNGRCLTRQVTGVERYATEVLRCLGSQVEVIHPHRAYQGAAGHAWEQFILPGQVSRKTILWSPANTGPLAVTNQVLTLHDLSPLEHPEWYKPGFAAWYQLFLPVLIRRVKRVMTSSEYAREKIIHRFHLPEDRVTAIHAGVNSTHFYRQDRPQNYGRYILFVGSIEPRKNLNSLLEAWKRIEKWHPDVSLVLAGVTGTVFQQVHLARDLERLYLPGYIPDTDLPDLYSGAEVFVLPSLDEGFGLPVLEAMACGTPVIASNAGALPEVVGGAGLLFDPNNPAALAELLDCCLSDPQLRGSLTERGLRRARQFSWQSTAERIWQTLRGAYEA